MAPPQEDAVTETAWTPKSILELSGAYWRTCALHAAVKLGIFTELEGEGHTAEQLAHRIGGTVRGVAPLLSALTAMGLLERYGDRYSDAPGVAPLLSKRSPAYIGYMVLHHRQLVPAWHRLDESVVSGAPVRESASHDEAAREAFLWGMFNNAMAAGPAVVAGVDLSGRARLLDFGGGPGTYALLFCQTYPELRAVVYDLPTSRPFAEAATARFGLADRVSFAPGDYHRDGVPGRFDAAWLSHVLHGEGPEACLAMLKKAAKALDPGGLLLVHEFILDDSGDGPLHPALFSLNMLVGTEAGRSYREADLVGMMEAAGAKAVRRLPVEGPSASGVLMGIVD